MADCEKFDVIIIGAGASGLAVGSELSKELKVLVLDRKDKINYTTKSWFIPKFMWVDGDAEDVYKAAMYPGVRHFLTKTMTKHSDWNAKLPGGYSYLREYDTLAYWAELISKNGEKTGSRYQLETHYHDNMLKDGVMTLYTSNGNFQCKLLIDASGAHSMIQEKYEIKRDYLWWSVYGGIFKMPKEKLIVNGREAQLGDYLLWGTFKDTNVDPDTPLQRGRPVLEWEVLEDNTIFIFILYLRNAKVSEEELKSEFEYVMKHEDILSVFQTKGDDGTVAIPDYSPRWGWYPSGSISQHIAEDHVAFAGSTACWTTPCGWGMGYIMRHYKNYSHKVIDAVRRSETDPRALSKNSLKKFIHIGLYSRYEILLDHIVTRMLSNAPAEVIDKFIGFFTISPNKYLGDQGPLLVEKVFTLTVSQKEVWLVLRKAMHLITLKELRTFLDWKDIWLIGQEGFAFGLDLAATPFRKLFGRKGKDKAEEKIIDES